MSQSSCDKLYFSCYQSIIMHFSVFQIGHFALCLRVMKLFVLPYNTIIPNTLMDGSKMLENFSKTTTVSKSSLEIKGESR